MHLFASRLAPGNAAHRLTVLLTTVSLQESQTGKGCGSSLHVSSSVLQLSRLPRELALSLVESQTLEAAG